jgi:quinol monooxygenase YgiN
MSEQISWSVELAINPDQLDSFVELTTEMVEHTATETGVLAYQRFVSEDGETVHALDRYESSEAALEHLTRFQEKFAKRFSLMVTRRRFTVYGTPSIGLKAVLDGFGAEYLSPLRDLPYWP